MGAHGNSPRSWQRLRMSSAIKQRPRIGSRGRRWLSTIAALRICCPRRSAWRWLNNCLVAWSMASIRDAAISSIGRRRARRLAFGRKQVCADVGQRRGRAASWRPMEFTRPENRLLLGRSFHRHSRGRGAQGFQGARYRSTRVNTTADNCLRLPTVWNRPTRCDRLTSAYSPSNSEPRSRAPCNTRTIAMPSDITS